MASKDTMNEGSPIVVLASRKTSRRSSDRLKFIETALINLLVATAALGQTARIEGAVFDAVTHQPPWDPREPSPTGYESHIDVDDGSFDLRQVPPGSYRLLIFSHSPVRRRSQPGEEERIGGETRIDVDGHPLEVLLTLHRAVDTGKG